MKNGIPTNQKKGAISGDKWNEQAKALLGLAKDSPKVRERLIKALLNPSIKLSLPEIGIRRVLRALQVAGFCASMVQQAGRNQSAHKRWSRIQNLLSQQFALELSRASIPTTRDLRELRTCLKALQEWWGNVPGVNWKRIWNDFKVIEGTAEKWKGIRKLERPRRGRVVIEYRKRIVASVELLRQCGVRDSVGKVTVVLVSFGDTREYKSVHHLWSRYGKNLRAFPKRENLPRYYLRSMFCFGRLDVNARILKGAVKRGSGPRNTS